MQTFLPEISFTKSAAVLDSLRLGKQRLECVQILKALGDDWAWTILPGGDRSRPGWRHHPVVKMWKGYEDSLKMYYGVVIREWKLRGYKSIVLPEYPIEDHRWTYPHWYDMDIVYYYRRKLLEKDYNFYSKYHWHLTFPESADRIILP